MFPPTLRTRTCDRHLFSLTSAALMLALLAAASQARAGTATLDTSFGSGGVVTTDVFGQGAVNALVLVSDSQSLRIVAAGTNNNVTVVARYLENGTLDSAFINPGGGSSVPGIVLGAQGSAEAIVRLANGNLLTGGGNTFTLNGFLVNGAFAGTESFPSFGGFSLATMHELIAVGDGTFLAAGEGYANRCALGKLDSSLKLDASFTGGGITQQPLGELSCRGLVRDPGTGQIYVTATRTPGGTNGFGIARFSSSGALDTAFGSGGVALVPGSDSFSIPRAMTRQSDGKLIVVGTAGSGIGATPKAALVVRFNSDGTLDPTFGPAGVGLTVFGDPSGTVAFNATAVVLQDDGRVLVGATAVGASNVKDGTGPSAFVVTRFTASGQYDVAFGDDPSGTLVVTPFGAGVSADLRAMALQPDGKLLVAGAAGTTQTRFALARYVVSGASVTPSSSTTTTTVPGAGGGGSGGSGGSGTEGGGGGASGCTGATNLDILHCVCAAGIGASSCTGQPIPASVGSNLVHACAQVDKALAKPAKKARTLLGRGSTRLRHASATLRSHRSQKKLSDTCRGDVEAILAEGRTLIGALRAGAP